MNKGKCLCEKVQFQVSGSFGKVRYCHCSQCRRMTGTAFSANAKVKLEAWELTAGAEHVREFEHKPGIFRGFCSNCGSPVYSRLVWDPDHIRVRLGTFEQVDEVEITGHVWVSSKANWYTIEDSLPCYLEAFTSHR